MADALVLQIICLGNPHDVSVPAGASVADLKLAAGAQIAAIDHTAISHLEFSGSALSAGPQTLNQHGVRSGAIIPAVLYPLYNFRWRLDASQGQVEQNTRVTLFPGVPFSVTPRRAGQ